MIQSLMMQGLPVGCFRVGHAPEASEILERRSFSGGAILLLFPLNYNALQGLSKLMRGEEDGSSFRRRG